MIKLNKNRESFCNLYLESGNASEAYRRAYPKSENWKAKALWSGASNLLKNSKVAARVKELQDEQRSRSDISKDRILAELSNIAFSSIADMHNAWIERKDFEKLTPNQKSVIKSISTKILKKNIGTSEDPEIVDVEYVKIELYDKLKAIERICKMLGFDAPAEVSIKKDAPEDISREDIVKELERLDKLNNKS